jgi:hypothetical protein
MERERRRNRRARFKRPYSHEAQDERGLRETCAGGRPYAASLTSGDTSSTFRTPPPAFRIPA